MTLFCEVLNLMGLKYNITVNSKTEKTEEGVL